MFLWELMVNWRALYTLLTKMAYNHIVPFPSHCQRSHLLQSWAARVCAAAAYTCRIMGQHLGKMLFLDILTIAGHCFGGNAVFSAIP